MQGGAGRRTGLSARRARRTKSRGYSRPRQTMADQSILKSAVLPASLMPLFCSTEQWHHKASESLFSSLYQKKKSLNFASSGLWHLKVGMETPENDFQIYRPINDPWHSVFVLWPFKRVKRAPNGSKNEIFKNWLDTRPKMETHDPNVYPTILRVFCEVFGLRS